MLDADTRDHMTQATTLTRARHIASSADARIGAIVFVLLLILVVSAGSDRTFWRVGDTNIRVELLAGIAAVSAAALYYRRRALAAVGAIEWLLAGWLLVNVTSSLLFSPNSLSSARVSLVLLGLFSIYLAVVLLVRSRDAAFWAVRLWVATGAAVALIGLVEAMLFALFGSTHGISLHRDYSGGVLTVVPMVTATIWEPNLFGAFTLSTGLVAVALLMVPRKANLGSRALNLAAVTLCFSAVILSLTRTVWFVGLAALVLMLITGVVIAMRRTERPALGWPVAAGAGIALGIVVALAMPRVYWATTDPWELSYERLEVRVSSEVRAMRQGVSASPEGSSALTERVGELGEWESAPTLIARQTANYEALQLWRERPWLGWGTDAFRHVARPEPHAPAWIPNVVLHVLFDTGLVGLVLLGSAVLLAVAGAVRTLARPVGSWGVSEFAVFGLLSALGTLALCYQMTDGSWMGFTWLLLALLVVSARHANRERVRS